MPAKPAKIHCSVPGCRAWAVRDTDPPLCSPHAGRNRRGAAGRAGAPPGNQNARTHGFYSSVIAVDDLVDLASCADQLTLDAEVACARIVLRGLIGQLRDLGPGCTNERVRLAGLALQAARTVSRLLRDKHALGNAAGLTDLLSQALDDLRKTLDSAPAEGTDDR